MKKSQWNYGRSRNLDFTIVDSCLAQTKSHSQINSLALQLLCDVIGHENQSQHYPVHRYLCLELSGRITTPDGFSYHTGTPGQVTRPEADRWGRSWLIKYGWIKW